jgi:hypothetical protein
MKTTSLPLVTFLAAIAAFALLPVSAVAASFAVTVAGILSILAADYGRSLEPLRVLAPVIPLNLALASVDTYRTAA